MRFRSREDLEVAQRARQRRQRRINVWGGHIEIGCEVNVKQGDGPNDFDFVTRLQMSGEGGYFQADLPDRMLLELHDAIGKILELPPLPVNVRVELVPTRARAPRKVKA